MNYLQLCQTLRKEAGVAGSGPSSVAGQIGELQRLIDWTSQSWLEIQLLHTDWKFLRNDFTFNTVASDNSYSYTDASLTDFSAWKLDSFRLYKQSVGLSDEGTISKKDYGQWRNEYGIGVQTPNRPLFVTEKPDQTLAFGPLPDDIYVVSGEYYSTPITLTNDSDTPACPAAFHMAIVFGALMKYAAYEAAPEVWAYAEKQYNFYLKRLEANQRDELQFGMPFA